MCWSGNVLGDIAGLVARYSREVGAGGGFVRLGQ